MTETEQALADAKRDIEKAVAEAAEKLHARTGLYATVEIQTLDVSTFDRQARHYVAHLQFRYGQQ